MPDQRIAEIYTSLTSFDDDQFRFNGEWERYLRELSSYRDCELAEIEEGYERARFMRGQFMALKTDVIESLTKYCNQLFWKFTDSGRQYILGKRAGLTPVESECELPQE